MVVPRSLGVKLLMASRCSGTLLMGSLGVKLLMADREKHLIQAFDCRRRMRRWRRSRRNVNGTPNMLIWESLSLSL